MFGVVTASWGMRFISDCNIRRGNAWMYIIIRTNMCTHILSVHCCSHIRPCKYRGSAGRRIKGTVGLLYECAIAMVMTFVPWYREPVDKAIDQQCVGCSVLTAVISFVLIYSESR